MAHYRLPYRWLAYLPGEWFTVAVGMLHLVSELNVVAHTFAKCVLYVSADNTLRRHCFPVVRLAVRPSVVRILTPMLCDAIYLLLSGEV